MVFRPVRELNNPRYLVLDDDGSETFVSCKAVEQEVSHESEDGYSQQNDPHAS